MASRVLYIVARYPVPSETFVAREIAGLRELRMHIDVVGLDSVPFLQCLPKAFTNTTTLRLVQNLRNDPIRALRAIAQALALRLHTGLTTHIHAAFLGMPAIVAYALAQILDKPYSLAAHARDVFVEDTPRVVLQHATFCAVCNSAAQRHLALRYPEARLELIRHGVDLPEEVSPTIDSVGDVYQILAVGRLVPKKGFKVLIDACALLRARRISFHCAIVGDGPERKALETQITTLRLEEHVALIGWQSPGAVAARYRTSHVLVAPSVTALDGDRDGVPNVILEAMSHKLAVVGTDAGAITDVILHNKTGLLVPEGDPQTLANSLLLIAQNDSLRERLASDARRLVETEFSSRIWNRKLFALYDRSDLT